VKQRPKARCRIEGGRSAEGGCGDRDRGCKDGCEKIGRSSVHEARLKELYTKTVAPALMKEFGYTNIMAVPKVEKITLNVGLGEATQNPKLMDPAVNELAAIAGQKPVVTKAKKSIAAFKLRENMSIGCMITLRGDRNVRVHGSLDERGSPPRARLSLVSRRKVLTDVELHAGREGPIDFPRNRL